LYNYLFTTTTSLFLIKQVSMWQLLRCHFYHLWLHFACFTVDLFWR